jgi:hypothetical protein
MTTTPVPPRSVGLAARAGMLLGEHFPQHVPGKRDGWTIGSQDVTEPRRMFVAWDLADGREAETGERRAKRLELAEALARAGYAVTLPADHYVVFFADRPHDDAGPRYAVEQSGLPGGLGGGWLVMDTWTRVHTTVRRTEGAAKAEAARVEREQVLADARMVCSRQLVPYLEAADELMGDGYWWLWQEVRAVNDRGVLVRLERLDALVGVARALERGDQVSTSGRRVTSRGKSWETWTPQSERPALGYFPHPEWERGPADDAAIAALVAGGLTPVRYGEPVGPGGYMVESDGFLVSAGDVSGEGVWGVYVSAIGRSAAGQHERVPEVLRAAGWRVSHRDGFLGCWVAFPPQGDSSGR